MGITPLLYIAPLVAATPFQPSSLLSSRDAKVSYDSYHVYGVTLPSPLEAHNLEKRFERYNTHPSRDALSIAIPHEEVESFKSLGLNARLLNSDLGSYVRSTEGKTPTYDTVLRKRGELPALSWFDSYHDYADNLDYWDDLVSAFPNNSENFGIGKSYENRSRRENHICSHVCFHFSCRVKQTLYSSVSAKGICTLLFCRLGSGPIFFFSLLGPNQMLPISQSPSPSPSNLGK